MRIIFLDIDGLFNNHEFDPEIQSCGIHPDKVHVFNKILKKTNSNFVLSSAWRYLIHRKEMNLHGMEWLLRSHGFLANRLIGITRPDTIDLKTNKPIENERGKQISSYLNYNAHYKIEKYLVIDDLDLGISAEGHRFLKIDGNIGLTESDVQKAVKMFGD